MRRLRRLLRMAGLFVAPITLVACGGGTSASSDIYAPVPTLEPTVPAQFDLQPVAAPTTAVTTFVLPESDTVAAFFEGVESTRGEVITGQRELASLEGVATDAMLLTVEQELIANDQLVAGRDQLAREKIVTFPRVLDVAVLDATSFGFTSCSETHTWFAASDQTINFVDQLVRVKVSGEQWLIDDVEVRHDGDADAGLTCAPPTFVERAEAAADVGMEQVNWVLANPADALAEMPEIFGGRIEEELAQIAAIQVEAGLERVSANEYTVSAIGVDPTQPNFMVVVSVCNYYPDGVVNRSVDTGEVIPVDGYPPGFSEEDWLYVWLEPTRYGEATVAGIVGSKSTDCWEG